MGGCRVGVGEHQRGLVVAQGLGRATHPAGGIAGHHRGVERDLSVAGGEGVPGQVGGAAEGGVGTQRLDAEPVELQPLGGQQVVGDRLREQGVPELVAALPPGLEHVVLDGGAQRGAERDGVDPGHPLEQGVPHPAADDRGDAHDPLGGVVEPVDAGEQEPGEVAGIGTASLPGGGGELLGEERVALGALGDPLDEVVGQAGAGAAHDAAQVGVGQRPEVDAGEPGQAGPQGERRRQGVAAVHVVAAVGDQQGDAVGQAAGEQQGQQLAGRLVGPVHVLDDDQERPTPAEVGEGAVDGLDEVGAHGVAAGSGGDPGHQGHQAGVVGHELVDQVALAGVETGEHLDEGQVGQARAALADAVADEGAAVGAQAGDVPDEGGLADAGVAAEEDGPTCPLGPAQGVEEPVDLLLAADELGGGSGRHGPDHGTRRRRERAHGWRGRPEATVVVRPERFRDGAAGPPTRRATKAAKGCAPSGRTGRSLR